MKISMLHLRIQLLTPLTRRILPRTSWQPTRLPLQRLLPFSLMSIGELGVCTNLVRTDSTQTVRSRIFKAGLQGLPSEKNEVVWGELASAMILCSPLLRGKRESAANSRALEARLGRESGLQTRWRGESHSNPQSRKVRLRICPLEKNGCFDHT